MVSIATLLASAALLAPLAHAQDWPMYGRDLKHSFSNPDSLITAANVVTLQPAWSFPVGDAVTASPAVVDGVVYVGSWEGIFYAIDATTGVEKWRFLADCQSSVNPIPARCPGGPTSPEERVTSDGGLITSSAAVVGGRVYFASGKTMHCLDAATGTLVWKRVLCGQAEAPGCETDEDDPTRIFSSPAISRNRVFVGHTTDGVDGYRGAMIALSARNGRLRWRFEVDPVLDANGRPERSTVRRPRGRNRGCGGIWSSAAVDERNRFVYISTADCDFDAPPPYHEAILALRAASGRIRWAFRPRDTDTCDFDFGASPNIVDVGEERWVGNGGKDGTYYMLDRLTRDPAGVLIWSTRVVFGGFSGGFIGSTAFDGQRIHGGTAFGELGNPAGVCDPSDPSDTVVQQPVQHAFDVTTGTVEWQHEGSPTVGASSVANGVVFVGTQVPPSLRAFDAATGVLVHSLPVTGAVNSSAAILGDMIVFGSGNSNDGQGGGVHAYRLP